MATDYRRLRTQGVTQEAFYEQAAIAKSSFYKWRKRLKTHPLAKEVVQFVDLNTLVRRSNPPRWEIELDLGLT